MAIGDKLFVADKPTLDTVKALLGANTDAAGTASVFARLAQIAAYVDQVEGYTDTLETLVGLANPATGGTDTLFKFLKQINDYVDTVETKIGLNTDAYGTSTVFARLAQIANYVDTLESSIGTNVDGVGTTTLFARLAQIAGYVDTVESTLSTINNTVNTINTNTDGVEAKTDLIGATTDGTNATTIFGKLALILYAINTDLITNRVGSTGDVADPNGTTHAKLRDIKNAVTASAPAKARAAKKVTFTTLSTTFVTALSVTGKGRLAVARGDYAGMKITLDGVDMLNIGAAPAYSNCYAHPGGYYGQLSNDALSFDVQFAQSMVIQILSNGTSTANGIFVYELEG